MFAYTLPSAGPTTLELFDILGRQIITLSEGNHASGVHSVTYDAQPLAAGTYFLRLTTSQTVITEKITVIR